MLDAKGRPIEIGDWLSSPNLRVEGGIVKTGAMLGKVLEISDGEVYLGDDISYRAEDIITWGGYWWVICLNCNTPWVKDVWADDDVCRFCGSGKFVQDAQASPASVAICREEHSSDPTIWCPRCAKRVAPLGEWGEGIPAYCPFCDDDLQY